MKTFKTLHVGDTLYYFQNNINVITKTDFKIKMSVVNNLKITDKGNLAINESYDYNRNLRNELLLSPSMFEKSSCQLEEYPKRLYFINSEDANEFVRKAVIEKINELENSIPNFIKKTKKEIESTREYFHELLNPIAHPNYDINQVS